MAEKKKHPREAETEKQPRQKRQKSRKQKEIKWDKLDNTAHLFPVIAGEGMRNVYRISVTLKEEIKQELLQEALERVLPWFDVFRVRMRYGVFWY